VKRGTAQVSGENNHFDHALLGKKTRDDACLRRNDVGVPEDRATTFLSRVFGNLFKGRETTEIRSNSLERKSCCLLVSAWNSWPSMVRDEFPDRA